jgi:hypothetical protein
LRTHLAEQSAKAVIRSTTSYSAYQLRASPWVDRPLDFRRRRLRAETSNVGAGINSRQSTMGDFCADAFVTTHLQVIGQNPK